MKKVVIIGGGFCGARVAKNLQSTFEVTLIDDKEYFEFTPGVLRVLVEPEREKTLQILHRSYLAKGKFIKGKVSEVSSAYVFINKKKIPYDYLVITNGSYYRQLKGVKALVATRGSTLALQNRDLINNTRVVIIGGGFIGVELAAEICTVFKEKQVTIINMADQLLERCSDRARAYASRFLHDRGVRLVLGEKIVRAKNKTLFTDKGTSLQADMVFTCAGIAASADFMKKHFSSTINERGAIKVNANLLVEGTKNIFAGGDVCSIVEEKTAQAAEKHAEIIIRNIRALEQDKPLTGYVPKKRPMLISLGKSDGILDSSGLFMAGFIPSLMKWYVEKTTMWKYA